MFCSSLRRRRDWSAVVPSLLRVSAPAWKGWGCEHAKFKSKLTCMQEQLLDDYDVAIHLPTSGELLKIILMTTTEAETLGAKARLHRFVASESVQNGIIMLVMTGPRAMQTFLHLQTELLMGCGVSIMPIPAIHDVHGRLNEMRRHVTRNAVVNADITADKRSILDIASCCFSGLPLSQSQVDILTDITRGLGPLASGILELDGREALFDHLGYEDANRVLSFFTSGPKPFRG